MRNLLSLVALLPLLLLLAPSAQAQTEVGGYYAAWLGPAPQPSSKQPVHVVVAGVGEKLKTLLIHAAYSQAKHWVDVEPSSPVLFLAYNEVGRDKMEALFNKWGLVDWAYRAETLTPSRIADETSFFPMVRSLDIYSHSARPGYAPLGAEPEERFLIDDPPPTKLTARFDSNSYAAFYGCNAGFDLAPYLAALWRVPVLGALTSADLQYLHSTNDFYAYNEDTRPPGPWATTNPFSFTTPQTCASGGCIRMKPDPHPYDGVHGAYPSGLSFYKFFCPANSADDCAKRMASTLSGWLSLKSINAKSDKASWKAVLADFICPIHATRPLRAQCLAKLPEIEAGRSLTYSPFIGTETACDFKQCYEPENGTQIPTELSTTSTFVREYRRYLRGLELLRLP